MTGASLTWLDDYTFVNKYFNLPIDLFVVQIAVLADWQVSSLIIYFYIRQFCTAGGTWTHTDYVQGIFLLLYVTIAK